jgi:hypothetical protein
MEIRTSLSDIVVGAEDRDEMARVPNISTTMHSSPENETSFFSTLTIGILAQSTVISRFEWKSLLVILP